MIRLEPMSEAEFASYLARAVPSYAQAHLDAGDVHPDEALSRARQDYDELLPEGLRTPNEHLFTLAHETLGAVGMIWFELRERRGAKSAYLYDFEIREDLRGRGLGREALQRLEERLRELGVQRVGLNVFGHNRAARALYEKVGFEITGIGMTKKLAPPADGTGPPAAR